MQLGGHRGVVCLMAFLKQTTSVLISISAAVFARNGADMEKAIKEAIRSPDVPRLAAPPSRLACSMNQTLFVIPWWSSDLSIQQ